VAGFAFETLGVAEPTIPVSRDPRELITRRLGFSGCRLGAFAPCGLIFLNSISNLAQPVSSHGESDSFGSCRLKHAPDGDRTLRPGDPFVALSLQIGSPGRFFTRLLRS
jgi:hypothetical protein